MYYVYILKGTRYYVGTTENITRRMEEHKRGNSYFTKRIGDNIVLIGWFLFENRKDALALETRIKKSGHIERWTKEESFIMGE